MVDLWRHLRLFRLEQPECDTTDDHVVALMFCASDNSLLEESTIHAYDNTFTCMSMHIQYTRSANYNLRLLCYCFYCQRDERELGAFEDLYDM